jgi:hypothetical protein
MVDVLWTSRRIMGPKIAAVLGRKKSSARWDLAELKPRTRILIAGLASVIGAITVATAATIFSIEMSAMGAPTWLGGQTTASAELPAGGGLENISTRPIFSRRRQSSLPALATTVEPAPAAAVALDRDLVLMGVFMNGSVAKAFVTSRQNPLGLWVQARDEISGWRVSQVLPDRVTLDNQNETLLVQLSVNGRPK